MLEKHNYVSRIRELCGEPETVKDEIKEDNENCTGIMDRFKCWISGFFISCIPIFGLAIFQSLVSEDSNGILIKILSDSELMFISVSVSVTAMYDYILNEKKFPWFYIIFILSGAIIFTGISIANNYFADHFNSKMAILLNVAFIFIVLIRGCSQYIQEYRRKI